MSNLKKVEQERMILGINYDLNTWIDAFLLDRKTRQLSERTIDFYKKCLEKFSTFCDSRTIKEVTQITSNEIRQFLIWLEEVGHNKNGVHAFYRAVRAFLNWWNLEVEPENWSNPIKKVKAPKVKMQPLEPASIEDLKIILNNCESDYYGIRDRAIILVLLDTGVRASELCQIEYDDLNPISGTIMIRHAKGGKFRNVFLGKKARRAVRKYLEIRPKIEGALFVSEYLDNLTRSGLRQMLLRRSNQIEVDRITPHSIRRLFALASLNNGIDIFTLQKLMGHADLQVLRRYLKQANNDLRDAHLRTSPADNM